MCAVVASSTAVSDPVGARKLGHASIGLSVAGVIITVVVVIIVVAIAVSGATSCSYYYHDGVCYRYRKYVSSYDYCPGVRSGSYCYSHSYISTY